MTHRTVYPFVNLFLRMRKFLRWMNEPFVILEFKSTWLWRKKKPNFCQTPPLTQQPNRHSGQLLPVAVILYHEKKGHAEWHPHPGLYIAVYATGEIWQFWPGSRDTDCGLVQSVSLQVKGAIHHVKLSDKAAANESIESFPRLFDRWIIVSRSVKSAGASHARERTSSSHLFTKLKSPGQGYTKTKA